MVRILIAILFCSFCQADEPYYRSIILKAMQEYKIPGVAIALYYEDEGRLDTFGTADLASGKAVDPDTIFEIASITKVFTATAIAVEILKGKMDIEDPVVKYLPKRSYKGLQNVTIEALATHTSSMQRSPPLLNNAQRHNFETIFHYLGIWNPPYPIGTRYSYSNLGFGVLGYALATVEDKSFMAAIHELILNPLEMHSTHVQVPAYLMKHYAIGYKPDGTIAPRMSLSALPASGALRSTAVDMLKFLAANLDQYGPKELRSAMQFAQEEFYNVRPGFSLGLGWQRITQGPLLIIDKNGGLPGFSSYIGMIPDKKIGIVILANKSKVPVTRIGRQILKNLNRQLNLEGVSKIRSNDLSAIFCFKFVKIFRHIYKYSEKFLHIYNLKLAAKHPDHILETPS